MRHPRSEKPDGRHGSQTGFSIIELIIVAVIIMVLVAIAAKSMGSAVRNYRLSGVARDVAATAQMAKMKGSARDARYRVRINTGARTYRVEAFPRGGSWTLDTNAIDMPLPTGVNFSTTGISSAPPGQTTTQAGEMSFNTRGLLIDTVTFAPTNGRCFYLQGNTAQPFAVCSTLTGKTTVYRLSGSTWEVQ